MNVVVGSETIPTMTIEEFIDMHSLIVIANVDKTDAIVTLKGISFDSGEKVYGRGSNSRTPISMALMDYANKVSGRRCCILSTYESVVIPYLTMDGVKVEIEDLSKKEEDAHKDGILEEPLAPWAGEWDEEVAKFKKEQQEKKDAENSIPVPDMSADDISALKDLIGED